jgi:hypothetical protein
MSGQPFFGQDGNYSINPESFTYISDSDPRLTDAVSGLTWATSAYLADDIDEASQACMALSAATYGGSNDWRIPGLRELGTILSRNGGNGSFPQHLERPQNSAWWTSTVDLQDATRYIGIGGNWPWTTRLPEAGGAGLFEGSRYTYCVTGPVMRGAWEVNADAVTVTHTTTGLMWHRSASANQAMDWGTALQYCEASELSGFTDWRLPTLREYVSVLSEIGTLTGYMSSVFGTVPNVNMLTGTPNRIDAGFVEIAWVREDAGTLKQSNITTLTGGARCVRGPVM